jgi:5'-nucleotidase (lipoprotein e(P4) family)
LVPTAKAGSATFWHRRSLEYCRLAIDVYDDALTAARQLARRHRRGSWAVILDADETVLDNSLFEYARNTCGAEFKDAQWESWVRADLAGDVPGAAAFTQAVHKLGGRIAIVTNRAAVDDAITQGTLRKAGIWFDYEIGMAPDHPDKTERWLSVPRALAAKFGAQPRTLMWLGDQITDFPRLDRDGRILGAMDQHEEGTGFGTRFFVLPNPMYGNWLPAN